MRRSAKTLQRNKSDLRVEDFADTLQAHVDQVAAYARDLSSYQAASRNRSVIPVLVKTLSDAEPIACGQVWITGATGLGRCIERIADCKKRPSRSAHLDLSRHHALRRRQRAVRAAVGEIDDETDGPPDEQPHPRVPWQPDHQKRAA